MFEDNKSLPSELDFASVLAAAVHDMKNSLSLLIQSIETLGSHVPNELKEAHNHISRTHYEASRLNSNLVQLLSLYRADMEQLPTTIDEHHVAGLLNDIVYSNQYYATQKSIELDIEVDEDLHWFLDYELIYLLLNDAVVNSMRYGNSHVSLKAHTQTHEGHTFLAIEINDDGKGYPNEMLKPDLKQLHSVSVKNGRTGLGLFFARLIAHAHENKGHRGEISLVNGGTLDGGAFLVRLP